MSKVRNFAQALSIKPPERNETPPPNEPVHTANPSVQQTPPIPEPLRELDASAVRTPPHLEPVTVPEEYPSASGATAPPLRTRPADEPVRQTKGYTSITNHLLDDVLPTLEPAEQVVLMRLYRLTRGHRQSRCKVSLGKLVTKTRVKKTRLRDVLLTLEDRGYIKRLPDDLGGADVYSRGMNFEMLLEGAEPLRPPNPSATRTRPAGAPNKEEDFKEKDKKATPTPEEIETYENATGRKWGE